MCVAVYEAVCVVVCVAVCVAVYVAVCVARTGGIKSGVCCSVIAACVPVYGAV